MNDTSGQVNRYDIAAWIITATALLLIFPLHLLSALLSGLLVYELVHQSAPLLRISHMGPSRAKLAVVSLLAALILAGISLLIWGAVAFIRTDTNSVAVLLRKMAEILEGAKASLPHWLGAHLPADEEKLRLVAAEWLRGHAGGLQQAGKEVGLIVAHILIGSVIGAIISLRDARPLQEYRPLAAALAERSRRLADAFRAVVFAQVRISAVNAFLAWLYLGVALPLAGVHLPLVKTMVAITFMVGLLPVIGNLISNCIIIVVSLSHSLAVSGISFAYLVVIHKLEYFLNARIVGGQIHAKVWELLLAIVVMESAFGISGVIAAPIYYAYLKKELQDRELV